MDKRPDTKPLDQAESKGNKTASLRIVDIDIKKERPRKTANKNSGSTIKRSGLISKTWKTFDPRNVKERQVTDARVNEFLTKLQKVNPDALVLKSLGLCNKEMVSVSMALFADNYVAQYPNNSEETLTSGYLERIPYTQACVDRIERETRQGVSSKYVHGRITDKDIKEVYTKITAIAAEGNELKVTPLVSKLIFKDKKLDGSPVKQKRWKEEAMKSFSLMSKEQHNNCKIEQCGFLVLKDRPYIGAKPDRIITCSCCEVAVVELKCPETIRDKPVTSHWNETEFLEMRNGKISLKKDHQYYYQIMGQMAAKGCRRSHFVVWTHKELYCEEISFDEEFWAEVVQALEAFFKTYLVKYLLHLKDIYFCPICEREILDAEELSDHDELEHSVCCSRCGCWFHFGCVPGSHISDCDPNWLCSPCQVDKQAEEMSES